MKPLFKIYSFYRNIPLLDQVKIKDGKKVPFLKRLFPFHFQRFRRSIWIEVPFVGLYIQRIYEE